MYFTVAVHHLNEPHGRVLCKEVTQSGISCTRCGKSWRHRQFYDMERKLSRKRSATIGRAGIDVDTAADILEREEAPSQALTLIPADHDNSDILVRSPARLHVSRFPDTTD
jgi:hypothetical protein